MDPLTTLIITYIDWKINRKYLETGTLVPEFFVFLFFALFRTAKYTTAPLLLAEIMVTTSTFSFLQLVPWYFFRLHFLFIYVTLISLEVYRYGFYHL